MPGKQVGVSAKQFAAAPNERPFVRRGRVHFGNHSTVVGTCRRRGVGQFDIPHGKRLVLALKDEAVPYVVRREIVAGIIVQMQLYAMSGSGAESSPS
jgi:hypothetical protein